MEQYIPKADVVAKIKKLIRENELYLSENVSDTVRFSKTGAYSVLNDLLHFLDTLEVKEVDLEKEINKYISDNFFGSQTMGFFAARTKEEPNYQDIALCAKHFFELGLKAQKGE